MEEIRNAVKKESNRLDYYIGSNLERNNTVRADELKQRKKALNKILMKLYLI